MHFIQGFLSKSVSNSVHISAEAVDIWQEITNVMVAKFKFPFLFQLFGVPKPLSAEVIREGVGGYRVAHFGNAAQFKQEIVSWERHKEYRFKFSPTKNFKVGHFMNLSKGPFEILTGGYQLVEAPDGIQLILTSNYQLHGPLGKALHLPFRLIVFCFQRHLLRGIRHNLKLADHHTE